MKPCKRPVKPCDECPYRIASVPGWLGGNDLRVYSLAITNDIEVPCHKTMKLPPDEQHYCSGLAITRVNSCKQARQNLTIIKSEKAATDSVWSRECFSFRHQFENHHIEE